MSIPEDPGVQPHPVEEPHEARLPGVTLEDVQANPELSLYIDSADRVMGAMGYPEHGVRNANLAPKI